jgi:hypothetical protein
MGALWFFREIAPPPRQLRGQFVPTSNCDKICAKFLPMDIPTERTGGVELDNSTVRRTMNCRGIWAIVVCLGEARRVPMCRRSLVKRSKLTNQSTYCFQSTVVVPSHLRVMQHRKSILLFCLLLVVLRLSKANAVGHGRKLSGKWTTHYAGRWSAPY